MFDPKDDKVKILHEAVSKKYDVGTLEEFAAKLQDPTKRKAFYDGVGKEYELGSFEEFEAKVKKKDSALPIGVAGPEEQSIPSPQELLDGSNPQQGSSEPLVTSIPKPEDPLSLPGQLDFSKPLMANGLSEDADKARVLAELNPPETPPNKMEELQRVLEIVSPGTANLFDLGRKAISVIKDQIPAAYYGERAIEKRTNYLDELRRTDPVNYEVSNEFASEETRKKYAEKQAIKILGKDVYEKNKSDYESQATKDKQSLLAEVKNQHKEEAEFTKGIPSTFEEAKKKGKIASYISGAIGNGLGQIPTSIGTLGASSYFMEKTDAYEQSIQAIAKENGITEEEVISKNLDQPAKEVAHTIGLINGGIDLASTIFTVAKGFGQGIKAIIKKNAQEQILKDLPEKIAKESLVKQGIKTAAAPLLEYGTEFTQGFNTQVAALTAAGKNISDINLDDVSKGGDIDWKSAHEEGLQGMIGSSGVIIGGKVISKVNENKTKPTGKGSSEPLPENIQKESVQVQAEVKKAEEKVSPKDISAFVEKIKSGEKTDSPEDIQFYENNKTEIEKALKNEPTGEAVKEEVRKPVQPVKEESAKPAVEEPVKPSESEPVSKSISYKPYKGGVLNDTKTGKNVVVTKVSKPPKGSALENEDFIIDITYPDGKKAINMPFSRFTGQKTPTTGEASVIESESKSPEGQVQEDKITNQGIGADISSNRDVAPKTIKQLEKENKKTFPKIPVKKVFLNDTEQPPRDQRLKADKYIEEGTIATLPKQEIDIKDIVPTQKNLTIGNLEKTKDVNDSKEEIILLKHEGKFYVLDGHHRIANEILNGNKLISANVYDSDVKVEDNKKLANKIAQDNGFKNSTHLINSVNKSENTDFKTVQEIPQKTIQDVIKKRREAKKSGFQRAVQKYYDIPSSTPRLAILKFFATGGKINKKEAIDQTGHSAKDLFGWISEKGISYDKLIEKVKEESLNYDFDEADLRTQIDNIVKGSKGSVFSELKEYLDKQPEENTETSKFIEQSSELENQEDLVNFSDEFIDDSYTDEEKSQLNEVLQKFSKDGKVDWQAIQNEIESGFDPDILDLTNNAYEKLKSRAKGRQGNTVENVTDKPKQESPRGLADRIRGKIRSLRSAQGEERQRIAQEIYSETGKYLLNREGIIVGTDASFADRTSDTFFDLIDEKKSVYLLDQDAKIAETAEDYARINETLEDKVELIDGAMPFDDAFSSGAIKAAKELGFDAIRLTEIDGTKGTLQVLNFDRLKHILGEDFIAKKQRGPHQIEAENRIAKAEASLRNANDAYENKKSSLGKSLAEDQIDIFGTRKGNEGKLFEQGAGDKQVAKKQLEKLAADIENARAELSKAKESLPKAIAADKNNLFSEYEGEQASTEKIYQPPIGSPKKKNRTERIAVSPIYGAEPKKLKQIVIDLSKTIKSKIYYVKNTTRRNALGVYRSTNAAIAIKFQGDLDTTAHEVGHSIDDLFDLLGKITPAIEKDLNKLSRFGSKPRKGVTDKKAYKLSEGLAEYIRAWMVNPSETSNQYPETSKLFDITVPSETKEALRKFGDDIRKFVGLSGHHQIMSNVQFEPEKAKGFFTKLLRNPTKENFELTIFNRFSQQWLNTLLPFEKAVKFLLDQKGIEKLMPSKNPVMLARLLAGENSKIQDILENGFIDPENSIDSSNPNAPKLNRLTDTKTGEAMNFEWLISALDNSTEKSIKEEQEKVISYMVAKRTVEMATKLKREDFLTGIGAGVFQDLTIANKRLGEHTQENQEAKQRIEESARRYKEYADAGLKIAVASGRLSQESYDQIKSANLEYVALQRVSESSPDEEVVSFSKSTGGALGAVKEIIYKQKGSSKTIKNPYESLIGNTANVIRESDRNNVLLTFKELLIHARGMHEGDPKNLGSIGTQVGSADSNTITIFDKGKKEHWKLQPDVYKAIKNITENVKLSPFLTALPSMLRWGIINFPVFAVKNRIRDIQARFVMSPNAFTGHDININRNLKKQTLEAYNILGGGQAGYYLMSEDFYYNELDKTVRELAKDKNNIITTPGKMLSSANEWYGNLIASGEIATRLEEYRSQFKNAKANGLDDYNAMIYASFKSRDLLDFAVAGEQMKWINQLIPFSNAAVQGLRKTVNSVKDDPGGFSVRFMLYAVLPSILLRMLAHSLDRDDDYAELPDYRRDLFYNIPVGDNLWIVIPKSFEIGVLSSGAERVFSKTFYGDKKALNGYAGSVARSVTPIDEAALAGPARSAVEVLANYDFFRKQHIIPTSEENLDLRLRNTETASRLGQMIGSKLSVDARQVDFLIKSNTGYFGDFAQRISDIGRDDTRHPIDFTSTGLFKNDPVYDSKSVQELMGEVKRLGIKSNDSSLQLFNMTLSDYFDQKDPKDKAEAGKNVRETAQFISDMWKKITLEDIKIMEYNIKKDVKK